MGPTYIFVKVYPPILILDLPPNVINEVGPRKAAAGTAFSGPPELAPATWAYASMKF